MPESCPLYPRKRTFVSTSGMSAKGQKRTWGSFRELDRLVTTAPLSREGAWPFINLPRIAQQVERNQMARAEDRSVGDDRKQHSQCEVRFT